ncbi:MAG: glycoside hydrolase family 3 C-terminal domain-containing protein [Streptosporangiales bacterium]|nr:glycoside hydrolase family 3 C-terminal domain-containing protein [Streptosporangiales bacterium]
MSRTGRRRAISVAAVTALGASLAVTVTTTSASGSSTPLYENPKATPAARAADLAGRMTLAEQIGQMVQIQVGKLYGDCSGYNAGPVNAACEKQVLSADGAGSILSGGGDVPGEGAYTNNPQTWASQINALEKYSIDNTRLHIPIVYGADVVHGENDVVGTTLFPQQIGLGASFDGPLVKQAQTSASQAAAATNVRWAFAPVADVDTNDRWGRYYEPFGEDPTLNGTLAADAVNGLQSTGIVASSVKHFAGYGASASGLDRTPADLSLRTFEEDQLPSYATAIKAGALSVMVDSGSVDGIPATGSHYLLTDVLRGQLGFTGVAISDWGDVASLATAYHIAPDYEHAIADAVNAGVDETMEPYDADTFVKDLAQAVSDHLVTPARVKQAAERVLEMKFRLGLFDHPYVDASQANKILGADLPLARQAASESGVLLKNDSSALPLNTNQKVVVTGPAADSVADTLGGWSVGWQGVPAGSAETAVTVKQGLQNAAGGNVTYAASQSDAVSDMSSADAAVVVLGRGPGAEGPNDQADPTLPADQQALVTALKATGKPVIVVLIDDRPDVLGDAGNANAVLMAWRPGTEGGDGVADLLYGKANPSGRLPVSWPSLSNDQPNSYRLSTIPGTGSDPAPAYPFGYGLSYTSYTSDVTGVARAGSGVAVTVKAANTGPKAGDLVVPVYASQPVSAVLVPSKRMVGFTRVHLAAGQSSTVTVNVPASALAVVGGDVNSQAPPSVEPGQYVFSTGTSGAAPAATSANSLNL